MNKTSLSESKKNDGFEEDDIFEDSSLLANFDNSFKQTSKMLESDMNESRNALNVSALCCDEEISGYDKLTGKIWIYPTNYPVRDYQFNIIKAAILKNTLVSLPTGLGKTFIAAVIMYNFYRWYPLGKIVFTAPTRPLVAQQIEACYNIIAIPPNDTIEMTGHMQVKTRKDYWQSKRVFFATPQVIYNDMKSGICPCDKIRCLVIDEAHKARGNYAYCQIISTLDDMEHKIYRLLALSATPGSKVEDVINVVKNLHIAHLELRTENCIDVAPYSHARKINTVVIELSQQLNTVRQQYVEILDGYARRLKQLNILPHNLGNLSKGRIVMLYKEFQNRDRGARHPQHNYIMKDFTLLIALYHGLELLVQHGSRVFLNFFDEHPEKTWIQSDDRLTALLERLRDDLGINPLSLDLSMLPDGSMPEIPENLCFGHPKFDKLKEIMMAHFTKAERTKQDTRAIVFCEYRESVNLVHCLLLQCRPLIKPQMFVGQGASGKDGKTMVSQKQQLRVMRSFREGACNALVATCVAEEGLDVGSVDLILCFDISTKSPIRLVQRCGRTGRERGGQVYILVTEGREHQTLMDCMRQRDGLNRLILQSKEVENNLYKSNPRMVPRDFTPQCQKMFITVEKKSDPKEKKEGIEKAKKGQKDLRSMLFGRTSTSGTSTTNRGADTSDLITEKEFKELFPDGFSDTTLLPTPKEYWAKTKDSFKYIEEPRESELKLTRWLEWQRTLQKTVNITHSKDSEILSELLQYADAKRFEMPASTQNPSFITQESPTKILSVSQKMVFLSPAKAKQIKKTKKAPVLKSPAKKDGDIRALFSTATKSTKNYTKFINDLGIKDDGGIPTRLLSLLVDLSLENTNSARKCYICQNICECSVILKLRRQKKARTIFSSLQELRLPDLDLIDDFDFDTVLKCLKEEDSNINTIDDLDYKNVQENLKKSTGNSPSVDISYINTAQECLKSSDEIEKSVINDKLNLSNNFDLELDFLVPNDSQSVTEDDHIKQNESVNSDPFDVGNIEDIFADSSPEEAIAKETEFIEEPKESKEVLNFFGLDSVEDIFADDEIDNTPPEITQINTKNSNSGNTNILVSPDTLPPVEYPLSPSILSGRVKAKEVPNSPILCSQARKFQLSTKKRRTNSSTLINSYRKQLIKEPTNNNVIDNKKTENLIKQSMNDTCNKSMLTLTQLEAMINKTNDNISVLTKSNLSDAAQIKDDNRSTSPILQAEYERDRSPILSNQTEQSISPILVTQTERKKSSIDMNNSDKLTQSTYQMKRHESLIILESDSDSDSTQVYDAIEDMIKKSTNYSIGGPSQLPETVDLASTKTYSPNNCKRKLDMDSSELIMVSPHFNKKQKLGTRDDKPLTEQDKSPTTLTLRKINKHYRNDNTILNCTVFQSKYFSQKENRNPENVDSDRRDGCFKKSNLSMLQMFRRDNKIDKNDISAILKTSPTNGAQKRKLTFDDSEDEFVTDEKHTYRSPHKLNGEKYRSTTNHKVRKKKKKNNSFLDTEAVLSDDNDDSDDELTDDSVGSIADFICDDSVIPQQDIHALYLKSVKSPVKAGAFKIPELPKKYNREELLSQYVDDDVYEMDSFCVDSNIGLTQVNEEMSELEVAEIMLEEKRKSKKKLRLICTQDDSPEIKVKSKPKRRQIHSDSEDSE